MNITQTHPLSAPPSPQGKSDTARFAVAHVHSVPPDLLKPAQAEVVKVVKCQVPAAGRAGSRARARGPTRASDGPASSGQTLVTWNVDD